MSGIAGARGAVGTALRAVRQRVICGSVFRKGGAHADGTECHPYRCFFLREGAVGDAELGLRFQLAPHVVAVAFTGEQRLICADDFRGCGGVFLEQLDAEIAQAGGGERGEKSRASLRDGVEERVAAADIGAQRVLHADAVAQMHAMAVARASAIKVR